MDFWKNKKVLVTGGTGFIGSHVAEILLEKEAKVKAVTNPGGKKIGNLKEIRSHIELLEADLRNIDNCKRITKGIDVIVNLAAKVGGIAYNETHHGTMLRDNILININMLEAARINNVERFLVVSSACVYPRYCKVPTPESEGFLSVPEPTNEGYGWAKRIAEIQAKTYAQEFGMKIAVARPYNAYGPKDSFHPHFSHVIPSIIRRVFKEENPLIIWGDGKQTRSFIFVTDLARGLIDLIHKYPIPDPVNLGSDEEVKIRDLVEMIIRLSKKNIRLKYDKSKPSGQPKRGCDTTKAKKVIGFKTEVPLIEGLSRTIEWYRKQEHL